MRDYKYFAFISYRSTDREWAQWLQHTLEHYHLPTVINGVEMPDSLYPVFLDTSELAGGTLGSELADALESSRYLIVICSPESAKSQWVDKEVQAFIDRGQVGRVIPFIVGGTPYGADDNCFVPALAGLRGTDMEQLGISVSESGREPAVVKVIARMLGLRFNDLWKRYERDKEAERQKLIETNNRIRCNLARFVAEKALGMVEQGDGMTAMRLALEALPSAENPDFPVTAEAEAALRRSLRCADRCYRGFVEEIRCMALHPDGTKVEYGDSDGNIRIFDIETSRELQSILWKDGLDYPTALAFHPDGKRLVFGTQCGHIREWDTSSGQLLPPVNGADYMHLWDVDSIEFTQDGRYMVSSYKAGFVIWDAERLDWLSDIDRERDFCFHGISVSPDGRHILCSGVDLSMYTLDTVQPRQVWKVRSRCRCKAVFSPDGSRIACAFNRQICILDSATGRRLSSGACTSQIGSLIFVPDGSMVLGCGGGSITSVFLDSPDQDSLDIVENKLDIDCAGAILPCDAPHSFLLLGYRGVLGVRRLFSSPFINGTDHIDDFIGFDESGTAIITDDYHCAMPPKGFSVELRKSHGNTSVAVKDSKGRVVGSIEDAPLNVKFYALSPDGKYIALCEDAYCGIWSVADGVCVYVPDLEKDFVDNQVTFSPDGRTLAIMGMYYGIHTFEFSPLDELMVRARAKCADMPLTAAERRRYYLD